MAFRAGDWKLVLAPGSGCAGRWGNLPRRDDAWRDAIKAYGRSPKSHDELGQAPFVQLFNVTDDPGESNNLAAKNSGKVKELLAQLDEQINAGRSTPGPRLANDRPAVNKFSVPAFVWKSGRAPTRATRILVWDEQQGKQKQAYPEFLGVAIAKWLEQRPGIEVRAVRLDDPEQGLSDANLDWADVLVWWGHVRQGEIKPETARTKIIARVLEGRLGFIALHSAHWSTPFMEAMNERTRRDARRRYPDPPRGPKVEFEFLPPPGRFPPARDSLITPAYYAWKRGAAVRRVRVDLPNCCFPDYRPDGAPSTVRVLEPKHPIAKGLPATFVVQHTEMYNEPFHVPEPDVVVFEETWEKGERFRSGCVWNLGRGKVFYFRPGHETFPGYLQPETLQVIENASRWLAGTVATGHNQRRADARPVLVRSRRSLDFVRAARILTECR